MTKVTKVNDQLRLTIPKEIADLKGWDEKTEVHFIPFLQHPEDALDQKTPILIKETKQSKQR